jgi:1-acyl-sn-glycerol-3-phosphate acyltransferase
MILWYLVRYVACWLWTLLMAAAASAGMLVAPVWSWLTFARPWGRGALALVGARLDIEGAEHLAGPAVYVSNHQSQVDVALLPAILPRKIRWVAKKELKRIPLWGWAFAKAGAVLIDRQDPRGAVAAIRDGIKELPEGWSVAVFPEGTRTRSGEMNRFKKGAFHIAMQTVLPMVPIGLDGARDIIPADAWVTRPGVVYVTVGEPIPTSDWKVATMNQHVAHVRQRVVECIERSKARRIAAERRAQRPEGKEVGV